LEPLRGDRKGHYSIRINDQWRICFEWPKGANGTVNVEITDYHWGGKHMARTAIHPGEHLAEELKALGMSAAALSRDINVPVNRITGIINGMRAITADTAIRLGHWFGTSAEFWLNLQKLYELRRAHADVGAAVERLPSLGTILREGRTRAPARMRLRTFNRTSSRAQPRKCTQQPTIGPVQPSRKLEERSPQASQAGNSKGTMSSPHRFKNLKPDAFVAEVRALCEVAP
jgi:addiction module HigA family antidote